MKNRIIHIRRPAAPNGFWMTPLPLIRDLYVRGNFELLEKVPERGIGIVGTRNPCQISAQKTRELVFELRGTDFVIISGFARGIDATAHQAALDAGLKTIAILGAGHDVDYPRENRKLREDILDSGGLILSEFPPGTPPFRGNFAKRNRLIAAYSKALCILEAGHRSGALNTAKHAKDLGRKIFALPAIPGDPDYAGNQRLLERHETWNACPLWDASSLGSVWLELSTTPENDACLLEGKLLDLYKLKGPIDPFELLHWATERCWNPQRFYETIEELVLKGKVTQKNEKLIPSNRA